MLQMDSESLGTSTKLDMSDSQGIRIGFKF